jgi:hypothetical protein
VVNSFDKAVKISPGSNRLVESNLILMLFTLVKWSSKVKINEFPYFESTRELSTHFA